MAEAHYICMVLIFVGSFVCGVLPACFSSRTTRSHPFFLSLILCLGAGVLLATSIVHMLTEVQVKLKMSAQLYFCLGFFILYAFDEISHYFLNIKQSENSLKKAESIISFNKVCTKKKNYGAIVHCDIPEEACFLESNDNIIAREKQSCEISSLKNNYMEQTSSIDSSDEIKYLGKQPNKIFNKNKEEERLHLSQEENKLYCSEIKELSLSNPIAKTGLLIALVIHSVLEGLSIGVQTDVSQIYLILGAVTFHKIVLSFCLGLELLSFGYQKIYFFFSIFIFSIGSSLGIYIGMFVTSFSSIFNVDDQLQAIAAGSLMYVAAFEVLPRERFRWQQKNNKRAVGIFQLLFVIFGFGFITALNLLLVPNHFHGGNTTENAEGIFFTASPF